MQGCKIIIFYFVHLIKITICSAQCKLQEVQYVLQTKYVQISSYNSILGVSFPVVCYIGCCACKWSANAKIPKFPHEGMRKIKSFLSIKSWKPGQEFQGGHDGHSSTQKYQIILVNYRTLIGLNCVQCFSIFPLRFGETNIFSEFRMAEGTTLPRILSYRLGLHHAELHMLAICVFHNMFYGASLLGIVVLKDVFV